VDVELVEAAGDFQTEISTSFELYRLLADRVRVACERGAFPLVLAGNCGSVLGALGGLEANGLGLVWLDAHGDFNTPETTTSGFLDGMALSIAAGRCWKGMAASIPGFSPLPEADIIHLGSRQLDPLEQDLLGRSEVCLVSAAQVNRAGVQKAFAPALANLRARLQKIYLHIDLDVLDPAAARANTYAPPGGLSLDQVLEAVGMLRETFQFVSGGLASYEPEIDPEGRALRAAFRIMESMLPG
jgi:arginase